MTLTCPGKSIDCADETRKKYTGLCRTLIIDNEIGARKAAVFELSAAFDDPAAEGYPANEYEFKTPVEDWLLIFAVSTIIVVTLSFLVIGCMTIFSLH